MTFALWEIDAGALLPEHSHHHEQVVHLYEGEFELTVEGKPILATPGTVFAIPPNARHSGRALTACRIMDVFYPVREDYRDGAGATILGDAAKSGSERLRLPPPDYITAPICQGTNSLSP